MSLPSTMRALRKTRPAAGAELAEVPVPTPGPGEVLIGVEAASICGTDLHIYGWNDWAAKRIGPARLPYTFGHELAGRVVAAGPGVRHPEPGEFVAAETHLFCGHCGLCRTGKPHICQNMKILGVDVDGAFADFVLLPAHNAWVVDPRIPPAEASIMEPFGNAVHTAFPSGADPELTTSTVAILGCGPIGLFAIGVARAAGARTVIAVEPNEFRRGLAKEMGADRLVDPAQEDPVAAVLEATEGLGAEVVMEMSGVPTVIDQGTRMLQHGGRLSLLGLPDGPVSLDLTDQVIFKEARVFGVTGRELFRSWQQTTTLLATGMVDVRPVITGRFPLERFEEAFDAAGSGRSGKIVLSIGAG
ncbi:MAG TPA: L-threonine 3-dehydrogenase [Actinomycetota bacterium]|nr:L-threonine 3-dehydrogenase [Actinomycetota bacterium]